MADLFFSYIFPGNCPHWFYVAQHVCSRGTHQKVPSMFAVQPHSDSGGSFESPLARFWMSFGIYFFRPQDLARSCMAEFIFADSVPRSSLAGWLVGQRERIDSAVDGIREAYLFRRRVNAFDCISRGQHPSVPLQPAGPACTHNPRILGNDCYNGWAI